MDRAVKRPFAEPTFRSVNRTTRRTPSGRLIGRPADLQVGCIRAIDAESTIIISVAFVFRRAGPADLPALHVLIETAYRGEASRAGWTTEADLLEGQRTDPDALAAPLAGAKDRFILALDERELVGSVLVTDEGDAAHVGMFAVQPSRQGHGIGSRLLAEAERVARDELQRREVRMHVIAQRHELIAWYARRGYAPTGERAPFPYGDASVGRPKRDDLEFVVLGKTLR